jgi:hypothetical protein
VAKTIIKARQRARIITFRGRMPASEVAQKEGCLRDTVLKIWNRHAKKIGMPHLDHGLKRSVLTGQVLRKPQPPEPLPPEVLIDHGYRLHELAEHQCSWPLLGRDEDSRLRFCGGLRQKHPTTLTSFYCEFHAAMAREGRDNSIDEERAAQADDGPMADDNVLDGILEAA